MKKSEKMLAARSTRYIQQIWVVSCASFRRWKRSPQIYLSFLLGFVACFLLSDKVVRFSVAHGTTLQLCEAFIWTFGDAASILLLSLCLLLLLADTPRLENDVPFLLIRISRTRFVLGQILYIVLATVLFTAFIFVSTVVLTSGSAFGANNWSDTAAVLGYSRLGGEIAVPAFVKVLEFTFPYPCALHVFFLLLGYALFLSSVVFLCNLRRGKTGMLAGVAWSGLSYFLTPGCLARVLSIPKELDHAASILFGWLSPLNHATYYMHSFGYDNLPKLWQSYVFLGLGSSFFFALAVIRIRRYAFHFTGTER